MYRNSVAKSSMGYCMRFPMNILDSVSDTIQCHRFRTSTVVSNVR